MRARHVLAVVIFLFATKLVAQSQSSLAHKTLRELNTHGITPSLDFSSDLFGVLEAGTPANTSQLWLDLSAAVDLGRYHHSLRHTRAFTSVHLNGELNSDLGGPVQSISGLQTSPGLHFAEYWIEHDLRANVVLRVGRIDANRDFDLIESAAPFLNSIHGYDPTFVALPNYNDTRLGSELRFHWRWVTAKLASFVPLQATGTLLMQEAGTRWNQHGFHGRIALGAWQQVGNMTNFDGSRPDARGIYAIVEQDIWRSNQQPRYLVGFLEAGSAPASFSTFVRHFEAGLVCNALTRNRQNHSAGISFSSGRPSALSALATSARNETLWELFYHHQISSRFSVTPDLQFISNSRGESQRNLYAFGARLSISLHPNAE